MTLEMTQKLYPASFTQIWEQAAPYTMTSIERGFALWQAVNHVIDTEIRGAFVECGVWKGGSAMIIALTLLQRDIQNRDIFLFDTFAGMTPPEYRDRDCNGHLASELMKGSQGGDVAESVTAHASLEEVQSVMALTRYDPRHLRYIVGDVRQTLAHIQTLGISLLRMDTDFYDSTLAELVHLYPRVSQNGLIIIDDYGHCEGARKAVDHYFDQYPVGVPRPMLWPLDYTGRAFARSEKSSRVEIERYDYVPPGFSNPRLLFLFPHAAEMDPWFVRWPYLRPNVPHIFRNDTRNSAQHVIGNASYEEAVCLYNIARQFAGKRGLEVGTHFGWTGAHLLSSGLDMDFVDPVLCDSARELALRSVFDQISAHGQYRLWPLRSPECTQQVRGAKNGEPWSFVFIDGDHDGDAPAEDAKAIIPHCATDSVVVFHDMTSPYVSQGLRVFQASGWSVRIYNTMQILGLAWRGDVRVPDHVPDFNVPTSLPDHLLDIPCYESKNIYESPSDRRG